MATPIVAQIPSSLSQSDPAQCKFAISNINLHNAVASPALRISVLPNSNFAIQSLTRDRIEYVQDTEIFSTSTSASTPAETPNIALLLKVHAGEGFQLSFELKGQILDSLSSVPKTLDTASKQFEKKDTVNKESNAEQDVLTHVSQGPDSIAPQPNTTSVGGDGNAEDPKKENSLGSGKSHMVSPESISTDVVGDSKEAAASAQQRNRTPGPIFFAEANSQMDILGLCRGTVFEQQLKDHSVHPVDLQPLVGENRVSEQVLANQTYTWTWSYPSKDQTENPIDRKSIFADPSSGNIVVLSQFSFWIYTAEAGHHARLRYSTGQATSASSSRHWRHASTSERFTSNNNRSQSFHTKGPSIPSSHLSLPSLPDATTGAVGQDALGPLTGSLSNLNPTAPVTDTEDGPLFRATVLECENNIRDMKASTKKIIKAAQTLLESRKSLVVAEEAFVKELEGFKPAEPLLNNYLRPMTQSYVARSDFLGNQMYSLLIDPLTRFYVNDIKAAEVHRKAFEEESKEYYQALSRYMGMKQDNNRKKSEADAKYEKKRRNFEIKRFEYWCFLLDMRAGGSKSDELLYHLTNYSEKHCRSMMDLAVLAEDMKIGLDLIANDLLESQKRAASIRKERQERKKELTESCDESLTSIPHPPVIQKSGSSQVPPGPVSLSSGSEVLPENNSDNLAPIQEVFDDVHDGSTPADQRMLSGSSPTTSAIPGSTQLNDSNIPKFSGIRDLEHQDIDANLAHGRRKEGFLFATNRPSSHNNSTVLEKSSVNWHKYWCVVSEGHLHEYSQWKKGVTMLHNEPINLKLSTVRPCRNQDRRFCFEVITPKYRRVYQATSAEDMNSWISVISNAIQSLLNGTSSLNLDIYPPSKDGKSLPSDISNTSWNGRTSMEQPVSQGQVSSNNGSSEFSSTVESADTEHLGTRLLKVMREAHPSNNFCAECGAKSPDWCAINLGILICIECSGIHRGLGTHISKVRSFTLDTTSYTRDLFDFIRSVGNEASNKIWEANLVQTPQEGADKVFFRRPLVNDSREYKISFVQKKYVEKAFVRKFHQTEETEPEDQAILATKALFQAVVSNSIVDVIAAYSAGADLNAIEESELENEIISSSSGDVAIGSDGTAESTLEDCQTQSNSEGLSLNSGESLRLSRSTIASSILNVPSHESQDDQQPPSDNPGSSLPHKTSDNRNSSFMVMQTSPLLLALRNGVPFSLDDQYEVYPMAEFMLQNGASSNLSMEVRLIEDDAEGSVILSEGASDACVTDDSQSTLQQGGLLIQTNGSSSNDNGWDSAHVDPEDIRNFQQRSNRRSLGQVVNLRGEGGVSAMEYLRAKSAARGEHMAGSPPMGGPNDYNATFTTSGSTSPSGAVSPRLRSQYATLSVGSVSAPTSVISSPSGTYSTTVFRKQQPSSKQQDISSLFQKRRESDSGIGPAAGKAAESDKKSGAYKLQSAALVPTSLTTHELTQVQTTPNSHGHSLLHHSTIRAHKVKATLSKSLRLSAAYIKNNMMKEEKEISLPVISSPTIIPSASPSSSATLIKQKEVTTTSVGTTQDSPSTSATAKSPEQPRDSISLTGSYVFLHKKGTIPTSNVSSSADSSSNPDPPSSSTATNPDP
ncbi:hypothetical protein BGX21_003620 [Mortierella sp. AD011]|nr:hypothetical protein BGX20_006252 [Mortierella sp. AD010]KAF9403481.1 hypothetical protein BGX21_003620 [Mortierella sp. AD011]